MSQGLERPETCLLFPSINPSLSQRGRGQGSSAMKQGSLILALERLMEGRAGNGQGRGPSKESPCLCNKHE